MSYQLASLVLFVFMRVSCQNIPCHPSLTVNITDGRREASNIISKHGVKFDENNYFVNKSDGSILGCICNIKECLRKCCGPDEILTENGCTKEDRKLEIKFYNGTVATIHTIHSLDMYLIHDNYCDFSKYLLQPKLEARDEFYIQTNGSLFLPQDNRKMVAPEHYCVDVVNNEFYGISYELTPAVCTTEAEEYEMIENETKIGKDNYIFGATGMIISMPFLLATFIAYALLPDRNLHMKALMCYVINLMFSYLLLVIVQLSPNRLPVAACTIVGYCILFFFMVSFFWMNVICIDIWFAFSGLRGAGIKSKSSERKRFLIYCVYAWGMSFLHVIVVFMIQVFSEKNKWYNPTIGDAQCFLKKEWPELFYFYGPMAILITTNIVLFGITACKIRRIKQDTSMLKKEDSKRHAYENDKQTFNLYLKLLFAMGVNWSMELISWAVDWGTGEAPPEVWYLTDFCNAIYGVFIFFIFVFKRSIWKMLKKRYYSFIGKPHLAHSMTQNPSTRVTSYSTANSSVQDHYGQEAAVLTTEA